MKHSKKRPFAIWMPISGYEQDLLKQAASISNLAITTFARQAAIEAAKQLLEQNGITVPEEPRYVQTKKRSTTNRNPKSEE